MSRRGAWLSASAAVGAVWLATMLTAVPAWASEDAHAGSWRDFIWQTLNFAALIGVLVYTTRGPIRSFFGERREKIVEEIGAASELLKNAELHFSEWQRKLVDLDARLDEIRGEARERAQRERDAIVADARAAAERIRRDAAAVVEQELRRARGELRREASELAVELAAKLLRQHVDDRDRERLLSEFIARVETSAADAQAGE